MSIVIPVYNESEGLSAFISELSAVLETFSRPCEVLLVDDGSSDGSTEILANQSLPYIQHDVNLGYGAAIKTGIQKTSMPNIVIIDADGTYPPAEIEKLVRRLEHVDMAVGARTGTDAKIPWVRRPAKWLIRMFAQWMVRRSIPDLNSGLRAFRRERVEPILRLLPDGFSLTTTITIAFQATGSRVEYIETEYRIRSGQSKFRPIADTWNLILVILRTVVLLRPLNFFLPLSLLLAVLAILVGGVSLAIGEFMDATFIVLMMASMQMFVLGLIADLIVRVQYRTH
ncbi:MAG: glycosyltransferase family 2 protein [Candidatus Hinthialibacter antarcticus]|nr:glycosyltransferase family 2 protein [Candidatus Hinthialibacter antarcticus]